ncbi:MAG: MBL fold metallo-hydrolase [Thermoanaerobaculia bacterium]
MISEASVFRIGGLTIEGKSRAGNETWFRVRELGLSLDIGRCPDLLVGLSNILVTHAHLDHALGIPYYAAQRRLYRLEAGNVFIPEEALDDYKALMALHEKLEGTSYPLNLVGMGAGETRRLRRDLIVRAHKATHRVPARAWELCELRHKLRPELAERSGPELARLREAGEEIETWTEVPLLFYTGDTDRRLLEESAALYRARILMIECSFTAEGEEERGRKYTHIHLSDLWDHADEFENEFILLTHFSLRDTPEQIHDRIRREAPTKLRERLVLALPEPFQRI